MKQVVRGFLRYKDKYLLVQHPKSDIWTLPGGHIEKWESLHKALKREIREEFHLDIDFLWEQDNFWVAHIESKALPIAIYKIHYESKKHGPQKKYEYIFHAQIHDITELKAKKSEIKDYTWLKAEEFDQIENIYPQYKALIKKLFHYT